MRRLAADQAIDERRDFGIREHLDSSVANTAKPKRPRRGAYRRGADGRCRRRCGDNRSGRARCSKTIRKDTTDWRDTGRSLSSVAARRRKLICWRSKRNSPWRGTRQLACLRPIEHRRLANARNSRNVGRPTRGER